MDKQPSYQQFSELTNAELNQVVGGDWWVDLLHGFSKYFKVTKETDSKLM